MSLELTDTFSNVIDRLNKEFGDKIIDVYQSSGDTFVRVETDAVTEICSFLKEELRFIYLTDIFGTDRFTQNDRFEIVYNMVNLKERIRLFVKTRLPEENPEVDSVTTVWRSAEWFERQTYDMFGIHFRGHPDLRRVYMPEDFDYYPLRKEFPLLGIPGSIELPSTTPDVE